MSLKSTSISWQKETKKAKRRKFTEAKVSWDAVTEHHKSETR